MAKKRSPAYYEDGPLDIEPEDAPAVKASPAPLVDDQFALMQWNGMDMYRCVLCQYDTLEGLEAIRAYKRVCPRCGPPPAPPAAMRIQAYDRFGNPIEQEA